MSIPNKISFVLSTEDAAAILDLFVAASAALPFLIGLSPEERNEMPKAGPISADFIAKALEVASMVEDELPKNFSIEEMRKDVELARQLYPIMLAVSQLAEKLKDTYAIVNSEAYMASLKVYEVAKKAKGDAGLEEGVKELSRRFAVSARSTPPGRRNGAPRCSGE